MNRKKQSGALVIREFGNGAIRMAETENGEGIEDLLTIQSGGRVRIPTRTLKTLGCSDGDLVFVKITKAKVSKVVLAKEEQGGQH